MTPPLRNVALIGYRGTGKSTVARQLARRWGWACIDADVEIERRAGRSIAEIFAAQGETGFRDLEETVVAALCEQPAAVLALGGGAVLREANRAALRQCGAVVWLQATVEAIAGRLADDPTTASRRPNLTKSGGRQEIERVLAERTPIYRACATLEVDTEGKSPEAISDEIVAAIGSVP
ncbi:MAG TPA: shikimate kinase [Lacipirellulaceae bacterium]|nr:shikimate kinase [Lacipirellulaceae bacterium]